LTVLGFFFGAQSASEDIRALSAVPASTSLKFKLVATTLGSSWNCAVWKLSSEVVVRAASASPAGAEKLHVVASAQGAARARDVRARHNIEHERDARHE